MALLHQLWQDALAEERVLQDDLIDLREQIDKHFETLPPQPKTRPRPDSDTSQGQQSHTRIVI
jgi:hypothetical protein